jgi:septin family protein
MTTIEYDSIKELIRPNSNVLVVGKRNSGKTTLANVLLDNQINLTISESQTLPLNQNNLDYVIATSSLNDEQLNRLIEKDVVVYNYRT